MANPYAIDFSPISQGIDKFKKKKHTKKLDKAAADLEELAYGRTTSKDRGLLDDPTVMDEMGITAPTMQGIQKEEVAARKVYANEPMRGLNRDDVTKRLSKLSPGERQKVQDRFEKKSRDRIQNDQEIKQRAAAIKSTSLANEAQELKTTQNKRAIS
ncbi:MAG: hypothetical protein KAS32_08515, partial [Candidatus Peribacteraceae bacterium]|nr:hypothetical protein [Candidatus Peribacteraceae bacterium]